MPQMKDLLKLGNAGFKSRLLVGTGKFSDVRTMIEAVKASGTQLVTVALRRFNRVTGSRTIFSDHSHG